MTEVRRSFIVNKCVHVIKVALDKYQYNPVLLPLLNSVYDKLFEEKEKYKAILRKYGEEQIIDEELRQIFNEIDYFLKSGSPHRALGFVLAAFPDLVELHTTIKEFNGGIYEDIIFERNLFNDILFDDRLWNAA